MNRQVVVNLIASTTTATWLQIRATLDENSYSSETEISSEALAGFAIEKGQFHEKFNCRLMLSCNGKASVLFTVFLLMSLAIAA